MSFVGRRAVRQAPPSARADRLTAAVLLNAIFVGCGATTGSRQVPLTAMIPQQLENMCGNQERWLPDICSRAARECPALPPQSPDGFFLAAHEEEERGTPA